MTHVLGLALMAIALGVVTLPLYWIALRIERVDDELRASPPHRCPPGHSCRGTAPRLRG